MAVFHHSVIVSITNEILPLRFIESMNFDDFEPSDVLVDKLKDDIKFSVRMTSGTVHTISVKQLEEEFPHRDLSGEGFRDAVFERWLWVINQ